MTMNNKKGKQKLRRNIYISIISFLLVVAMALLTAIVVEIIKGNNDVDSSSVGNDTQTSSFDEGSNIDNSKENTANNNTTNKNSKTATVINTGDILIHDNVLWGAKQSDGSYNFSQFFKKANTYIKSADYAVANLEVTLGGTEAGPYKGYPNFNCPDSLLDYVKSAGFDALLTANNHILDNGLAGMKRTTKQIKEYGLDCLGTRETTSEQKYIVKNINGIKIGMVSYTYGTNSSASGANELINYFSSSNLSSFYTNAKKVISDMKDNGAEAIVFYMHWGKEYQTSPNTYQKAVAQKLCNMGVDVIVGGHPHVLQPIELIHAEDSQNTTVCLYSTGNAISNQRISEMTGLCETGHTEDGVLFSYTFERDSDGEVYLSAVDIIPTWVDRYGKAGNYQYTMYPLESADMANEYDFDANTLKKAKASYERTKKIMQKGLTECQKHLGCKVRFAETEAE